MDNFTEWLLAEIDKRKWTQADLSRASGLTTAGISRILSGSRGAGIDALNAIAGAFNYPLETVYRQAGLLPPSSPNDPRLEELRHLFNYLDDTDRQDIIEYTRLRLRLGENKGKYTSKE
uniref:Putative DNA binding, helix-turn-helix domain containing protein n=1 Tax=viral metagenome TaxID=1070528 RepID=A0A6M3JEI9_9ZZZZ